MLFHYHTFTEAGPLISLLFLDLAFSPWNLYKLAHTGIDLYKAIQVYDSGNRVPVHTLDRLHILIDEHVQRSMQINYVYLI